MAYSESDPLGPRYKFDNFNKLRDDKLYQDYQAYKVGALCMNADKIVAARAIEAARQAEESERTDNEAFTQLLEAHDMLVSSGELATAV